MASKRITISFSILLLIGGLFYSCKTDSLESYLADINAEYNRGVFLPVTICTSDSSIMLTVVSYGSIIDEIRTCHGDKSFSVFYRAITENIPIVVSSEFYKKCRKSPVIMDEEIYNTYQKYKAKVLIDKYFKEIGGALVLRHHQQMFSLKGHEPIPVFNPDINDDYIIYLLFKEKIYISDFWWDEDSIGGLCILESISDIPE